MNATLARYAPWMLSILRIVTALVYMEHGTMKLFHFPPQARFGGPSGPAGGLLRRGAAALEQGVDAASSAIASAIDSASSAASGLAEAASSMAASVPPANGGAAAPDGMPPSMQAVFLVGGLIELIGGLALVLGLLTRPVAFLVAGETAVIFWWMHVGRSGNIFPATNGGEAAVLFCFTFLYLVFAGPGAFALDNVLARRRKA